MFEGPANWLEALVACTNEGGSLASIESAEEQQIVEDNAADGAWIGLNDILNEGTATWVNGASVGFTNWRNNQPNNGGMGQHCVWVRSQSQADPGTWDDVVCNRDLPYVCQTSIN